VAHKNLPNNAHKRREEIEFEEEEEEEEEEEMNNMLAKATLAPTSDNVN
jgi:hypothetical protein